MADNGTETALALVCLFVVVVFFFFRMAIYLRREVKSRLWGVLFGFKLRFNKKGNSGVCTVFVF